jgi:flagellar L-ring protein precursor FlgH
MRKFHRLLPVALAIALSGCNAMQRLEDIGKPPDLAPVTTPVAQSSYQPHRIPMPAPTQMVFQPNSLWASGSRSFFKDQRAAKIGDILTVQIAIEDKAQVANTTARSRSNEEGADASNLLGLESYLDDVLPDAVDPGNLVSLGSDSTSTGTGTVNRSEEIELMLAAVVTDILPNGNLVIQGRQEVRVNFELRELLISGVVRPEDITNENTIQHTQIAEARISYGGRGQITDVQQPRYGQQALDIILPF